MKEGFPFFDLKKWTVIIALGVCAIFLGLNIETSVSVAQDQGAAPAEAVQSPPTPDQAKEDTKADKESDKKLQSTGASSSEELTNESCMDCHNPDILKLSKEDLADQVVVEGAGKPARTKPPFVFGQLNLAIQSKKFSEGAHAETTCVQCHNDVTELPHGQRLKKVDCKECHEEFVENIQASAHAEKPDGKGTTCIGCHDVHYGKGKDTYSKDFHKKACLDCHNAYKMDTAKSHSKLYEPNLHLKLECMLCHQGKQAGVHNILPVKTKVAQCDACHQKNSILSKEKAKPKDFLSCILDTNFINKGILEKYGYVIGANRIPVLDTIIILAILGPLGLPVVHGGLRFITRRKEPLDLSGEKILLHPLLERIWHWVQALCIVMLIITGAMIHWPEYFAGWFNWAVSVHNLFGVLAVGAFLFWLVYNLVTGRISHYIPRRSEIPAGMITQAKFYAYGIFKHEPHPYAPSEDNKFNPLQKIAYFKFQVLLFPVLLISGIMYMYPDAFKGIIDAIGGVWVLGTVHLILGGLFAAFLMAHLYLATTGETIGENFKAMVFGYGIKSDHGDDHHNV